MKYFGHTTFLFFQFVFLTVPFYAQAARNIIVNNKSIVTGHVYELHDLVSSANALDEFYAIIESHLVLVDFYASWCKPCKTMTPRFKELAAEADHVLFIKIDVDKFRSISQAYGIKSLPSFISFRNGQEVARIVEGIVSKKRLQAASRIC